MLRSGMDEFERQLRDFNDAEHPSIEELKRRVNKFRELGTLKIALVGGEPVCHHSTKYPRKNLNMIDASTNIKTFSHQRKGNAGVFPKRFVAASGLPQMLPYRLLSHSVSQEKKN